MTLALLYHSQSFPWPLLWLPFFFFGVSFFTFFFFLKFVLTHFRTGVRPTWKGRGAQAKIRPRSCARGNTAAAAGGGQQERFITCTSDEIWPRQTFMALKP